MTPVITWIRANVFIVIFIVVMLVAVISFPMLAAGMNKSVREEAKARADFDGKLRKIGVNVAYLDPISGQAASGMTVVNRPFLEEYKALMAARAEDAAAIHAAAVEFNRKDRTLLRNDVFPAPSADKRSVIAGEFYETLLDAYAGLLNSINAGSPPDPQSLEQDLKQARARFLDQEVNKTSVSELSPDEMAVLRERLTSARLSGYVRAAEATPIYMDESVFPIPAYDSQKQPGLGTLYEWQWDYWVAQDIVAAIAAANADARSVIDAPIKRVYYIEIPPLDKSKAAPAKSGGSGFGANRNAEPAAPSVAPVNYKNALSRPIEKSYETSFTGRTTNPLFDVRPVRLALVVDSTRVPEVLDAIARQNLMTVTNLRLLPSDPFADMDSGYTYGPSPTVKMVLDIETLWMREWTTESMPDELKTALGIAVAAPPAG